jgi:predicted N-acetyltransferase YhbS
MSPSRSAGSSPIIRPLREDDFPEADRIFRLAFGTFVGLPDPLTFAGDSDWTRSRLASDPAAAFAAELDGRLVGSNFATTWGTVGFFGPLSVHPELWNAGIAKHLLGPTMELLDARGCRLQGLFTFAQSPKHVGLYQRFDFWPRFLVAVMARPSAGVAGPPAWSLHSATGDEVLPAARALTTAVYDGFDVGTAIRSVRAQRLGDTVLVHDGDRLAGLAVCHCGAGSEGGSGTCFVKVGAVAPGPDAGERFEQLLDASAAFAAARGLGTLVAGVDTGQRDAYRRMLARGFRTVIQGVVMVRGDDVGLGRPDRHVLADWR